jgi:hypothetical protein
MQDYNYMAGDGVLGSGEKTLKAQYDSLESYRSVYINRAESSAEVTIPHLFPRRGSTSATEFYTPYQSIGSNGVNGLSAKLQLALLPPSNPFFRLVIDEVEANKEGIDAATRQEFDRALQKVEREVMKEIEIMGLRNTLHEAMRQLIISGNALVSISDEGCRLYRLGEYMCERDPKGNVTRIITRECISPEALPEEIRAFAADKKDDRGKVELFTGVFLRDGKWETYQEACDQRVPKSEGQYKKNECPYLPLRWNKVDGEHYGRSYVEEYIGDLNSAEGLSKAILDGSAAAARLLFLVNPNSTTNIRDISETVNGGFCAGRPEDVQALQINKQGDMSVAMQVLNGLQERLNKAFLSGASGVRNAERVTAAEIRLISQELETTLGGLYSVLSAEFQMPLVSIMLAKLKKQKKVDIPEGLVAPAIVTGVDALGRNSEVQNLTEFTNLFLSLGGEQAARYINLDELAKRVASGLNVDPDNLIKTQEDMQMEQQNAMMQNMAEQAVPQVTGAIAQNATQTQ